MSLSVVWRCGHKEYLFLSTNGGRFPGDATLSPLYQLLCGPMILTCGTVHSMVNYCPNYDNDQQLGALCVTIVSILVPILCKVRLDRPVPLCDSVRGLITVGT